MTNAQPYTVRTQLELETELEARMRDTSNARWTDAEYYRAINMAINVWGDRVLVPFIYSPANWSYSTREYALPNYVHEPVDVYYKSNETDAIWREFNAFEIQPTAAGAALLAFAFPPRTASARIIYWKRNSNVPIIPPNQAINITAADTTLALTMTDVIGDNGFIKIENEWIAYHGVTLGATTRTLLNMERGVFGTTAAIHNATITVYWGTAVYRSDLYEQLFAESMAYLHSLPLNNASATEKENYIFSMRYWKGLADSYWPRHTQARKPRRRLNRQGVGEPLPMPFSTSNTYAADQLWQYYSLG